MQNALYTACDSCAKVIDGIKGTAEVKEKYISIKGSILMVDFKKDGEKFYYYPTPKGGELLHFCNPTCFGDYCSAKKYQYDQYKNSLEPIEDFSY